MKYSQKKNYLSENLKPKNTTAVTSDLILD